MTTQRVVKQELAARIETTVTVIVLSELHQQAMRNSIPIMNATLNLPIQTSSRNSHFLAFSADGNIPGQSVQSVLALVSQKR